jgi:hypothetical protein
VPGAVLTMHCQVVTLVNLIVGIMMFTDAAFVWKASFGCLAEALR